MLVVVTVSTGVPAVILSVAYKYFWQLGLALESFWCYQILATKSLKVESDRVYIALKDKGPFHCDGSCVFPGFSALRDVYADPSPLGGVGGKG